MRVSGKIEYENKVYCQPDFRIKICPFGGVTFLIKNDKDKWYTIKTKEVNILNLNFSNVGTTDLSFNNLNTKNNKGFFQRLYNKIFK